MLLWLIIFCMLWIVMVMTWVMYDISRISNSNSNILQYSWQSIRSNFILCLTKFVVTLYILVCSDSCLRVVSDALLSTTQNKWVVDIGAPLRPQSAAAADIHYCCSILVYGTYWSVSAVSVYHNICTNTICSRTSKVFRKDLNGTEDTPVGHTRKSVLLDTGAIDEEAVNEQLQRQLSNNRS